MEQFFKIARLIDKTISLTVFITFVPICILLSILLNGNVRDALLCLQAELIKSNEFVVEIEKQIDKIEKHIRLFNEFTSNDILS